MRALITGDWQAAWANLRNCNAILDQVLSLCKAHKIKTVLHLGDLKHHYSPVDVRVVNFGVRFVTTLRSAGITPFILLGNHDRVSMSVKSDNWFPALKAAGAITIGRPTYFSEHALAAVPYVQDYRVARRWFRRVAAEAAGYKGKPVLLFHHEVAGSKLNVTATSDTRLRLADLRPETYRWCFGGHIHLYQRLADNVYYVGSPFAHDWGEANQQKGLVLLDGNDVQFIPGCIPGMYDPSLPNFKESRPKTWEGASVRINVVCDKDSTTNYQSVVSQAKVKAEAKYRGADITVIPQFIDHVDEEAIDHDGTDESVIKGYVVRTCPPWMSNKRKALTSRLLRLLAAQGALRTTVDPIKFLSAEAEQFLSFRKVKARYRRGITVITGKNLDWAGRNNGSGKTSFLQLPAVALFGSTLKGQANDRWTTRGSSTRAFVKLKFRIGKKLCEVHRQRRPGKLAFTIDGKDQSVGIGIRGTQQAIQDATGLTWETLRNAVYIDQAEVSLLLRGTDKERKALFSKFLNLERFERARAAASVILSEAKQAERDLQFELASCRQRVAELKLTLQETQSVDVAKAKATLRSAKQSAEQTLRQSSAIQQLSRKVAAAFDAEADMRTRIRVLETKCSYEEAELAKHKKLAERGQVCPTCRQPIKGVRIPKEALAEQESKVEMLEQKLERLRERRSVLLSKAEKLDAVYARRSSKVEQACTSASMALVRATEAYKSALEKQAVRDKLASRLATAQEAVLDCKAQSKKASDKVHVYEYIVQSLGKDGIPAYLSAGLCPALNRAAAKYSELFTDNELQVRFITAGADIDVSVVNVHGGEAIEDQSQGETRLAGLVTGFALREVINPCSMLILDEPSESLDAVNAKAFAEGLRKVANHLGTVLLTSHNPWILGELGNQNKLEIRKSNGVSRIIGA